MQDKLQELTEKLYNEGLSKGKAEGEAIIGRANKEAGRIIESARKEAEALKKAAEKEADDYSEKVRNDLKMACDNVLQGTRKDIENLVVGKITGNGVSDVLSDPTFLKEVITEVARKFSTSESQDINLILPKALQDRLEPFVNGELASILGKGVDAQFSKKVGGGFSIGPRDGSWFISLTDETFKSLIGEYLRPATKKLLFG